MIQERTAEGLETRLRPRGFGRFVSAPFLLVWLCGWAVGEGFALWLLYRGVLALLGGAALPGNDAPAGAQALMIGLFLVVWLSFWTLGGYLAARELLRLIWSEDRIVARHDALVVHRGIGPFRSTRTIARDDLLQIQATPKRRLVARTPDGAVELTSLASRDECESLAKTLQSEMGLKTDAPRDAGSLPEQWSEVPDAEGGIALVQNERVRRARGRFAWILTTLCASAALALVATSAKERTDQRAFAGILAGISAVAAWGSWRLSHTRLEWRLEPGRLRLRRRSARRVKEIFEGTSLELIETSDSDGDAWFTLHAVAADAPQPWDPSRLPKRRHRRRLAHVMDDASTPRRLGAWLARKTTVRLEDLTTPEHRLRERAALIARLEAGGRFSRWMAKRIPRS